MFIVILDHGMAIDPPTGGNFGHYAVLIPQYICHRMRHVSSLRSVTSHYHITSKLHTLTSKC